MKVTGGTAGELPAGDGSSQPFVEMLMQAGIVELETPQNPLVIRKPEQVSIGEATLACARMCSPRRSPCALCPDAFAFPNATAWPRVQT